MEVIKIKFTGITVENSFFYGNLKIIIDHLFALKIIKINISRIFCNIPVIFVCLMARIHK